MIKECDGQMQSVFSAQANLSSQVENLAKELDSVVEETHLPNLMSSHMEKLVNAKNRLQKINSTLTSLTIRLEQLYKDIEVASNPTPTTTPTPAPKSKRK